MPMSRAAFRTASAGTFCAGAEGGAAGGTRALSALPEWDLSDLYTSPQAPEVAHDLDASAKEARRIKEAYQGKLATAAADGAKLTEAVKAYEALSDLMGKLGSYAALLYSANQADPARKS
jgi:oligoendopeptidase F